MSSAGLEPNNQLPSDVLAARIRLNAASELRVLVQEFSKRRHVHIRQYILSDENDFVPTGKGVSVPIEQLENVLDAVRELRAAGSTLGTAAVVQKNNREEIRFSVSSWQGATKADIRTYFDGRDGTERKPGKGIRFNLALLPQIERGLEALDRVPNG